MGSTGAQSRFFEILRRSFAARLPKIIQALFWAKLCPHPPAFPRRRAAADPAFQDVIEKRNCAYINKGVLITKYTGSRGKAAQATPTPNFGKDKGNVKWQKNSMATGELARWTWAAAAR